MTLTIHNMFSFSEAVENEIQAIETLERQATEAELKRQEYDAKRYKLNSEL